MLNRFAVGLGDACRGAFAKDAKRAAAITAHTIKEVNEHSKPLDWQTNTITSS